MIFTKRGIFVIVFVTIVLWPSFTAEGATRAQRRARRAAIRQMDILDRPNRFGHIYGNTVRRIYRWRSGNRSF